MIAPWMVVVTCIASASVCGQIGTPDLGANNYATRADCDMALIRIAERWRPITGAYRFKCRQWPW